jgi:hypothetical protein
MQTSKLAGTNTKAKKEDKSKVKWSRVEWRRKEKREKKLKLRQSNLSIN